MHVESRYEPAGVAKEPHEGVVFDAEGLTN